MEGNMNRKVISLFGIVIVALGAVVLLVGGLSTARATNSGLRPVNITGDTWVSRASMSIARGDPGAATLNGKIHVIGGWVGSKPTSIHEVYDPQADAWQIAASVPI